MVRFGSYKRFMSDTWRFEHPFKSVPGAEVGGECNARGRGSGGP